MDTSKITEIKLGVLSGIGTAADIQRKIVDMLEAEFPEVPWSVTVTDSEDLEEFYQELIEQAEVEARS